MLAKQKLLMSTSCKRWNLSTTANGDFLLCRLFVFQAWKNENQCPYNLSSLSTSNHIVYLDFCLPRGLPFVPRIESRKLAHPSFRYVWVYSNRTVTVRTLFSMVMSRFRGRRSLSLYCILFNLLTSCYSMNMDMTIENKVLILYVISFSPLPPPIGHGLFQGHWPLWASRKGRNGKYLIRC